MWPAFFVHPAFSIYNIFFSLLSLTIRIYVFCALPCCYHLLLCMPILLQKNLMRFFFSSFFLSSYCIHFIQFSSKWIPFHSLDSSAKIHFSNSVIKQVRQFISWDFIHYILVYRNSYLCHRHSFEFSMRERVEEKRWIFLSVWGRVNRMESYSVAENAFLLFFRWFFFCCILCSLLTFAPNHSDVWIIWV